MNEALKQQYDQGRDLSRNMFRASCYAPFGSLYFNPLGYVGYCCHNQTEQTAIGRIGDQRLGEIWRGKKAEALRKTVLEYAFPKPSCSFCQWQVDSGNLEGVFARKYDDMLVGRDALWPRRMEFAMSNVCNFECSMCNGDYSSLIRKKTEKKPPLPMVYGDEFFADMEEFLPHIRQAEFMGGEPFLASENYRIWEMMVGFDMGERTKLKVTTNGSVLNSKVEQVMDRLPFHFTVSLEGVSKDTQDAIRINSDLGVVLNNVQRFLTYAKERRTGVNFAHCLMQQNWHGFGALLEYAEDLDCDVWVNVVRQPKSHSLYELPREELSGIVAKMESERDRLAPKLRRNRALLEQTVEGLRAFVG
ncbi:MAG: radical SAM protein [Planctomycetota bacterium]|jgi:radical SAM protein with 4Fe4S-binding SPASM domain